MLQLFMFSAPSLQEYVFRVDPLTSLGLNSDSIVCYRMGGVVRAHASEVPELLPCGYLVGDNNIIKVNLKGTKRGVSIPGSQRMMSPGSHSQGNCLLVEKCVMKYLLNAFTTWKQTLFNNIV